MKTPFCHCTLQMRHHIFLPAHAMTRQLGVCQTLIKILELFGNSVYHQIKLEPSHYEQWRETQKHKDTENVRSNTLIPIEKILSIKGLAFTKLIKIKTRFHGFSRGNQDGIQNQRKQVAAVILLALWHQIILRISKFSSKACHSKLFTLGYRGFSKSSYCLPMRT